MPPWDSLQQGGGALLAKRQRLLREGVCINDGICNGCQVLARCGLPRALIVKKDLAGGSHGR